MERFSPEIGRNVSSRDDDDVLGAPPEAPAPEAKKPKKRRRKGELPPELESYRAEGQAFLDGQRHLFSKFAKDVSLTFTLGTKFFIDLEKGDINLDTRWFAERGFTREQILWAVFHEMSHFRDLSEDPEGMMKGFAEFRKKAQRTGAVMMKKWEEKYGADDPELLEKLQRPIPQPRRRKNAAGKPFPQGPDLNAVESAAYRIHHTFGNVFDDIFVNANVAYRAPAYEPGRPGGAQIERLYREKLFKGTDYRKKPKHLQFLYALLRGEMVPGEQVEVADEVRAALEKKIRYAGKSMTAAEVVRRYLKPGGKRNTKANVRGSVISYTLEPLFHELLMQDLAEWDPQKPPPPGEGGEGEPGEGEGGEEGGEPSMNVDPFGDDYDDFDENSPDQLPQEDMDDLTEQFADDKDERDKDAAKDAMTPEERAQATEDAMAEQWCKDQGIDPADLERFRRVEAEVAPYINELSALWDEIIRGSAKEMRRETQGHFKTGTELDVQKVVDEWPKLGRGGADEARVMRREVSMEDLVRKPDLIRVRLVGDASGSMDDAKKRMLERCEVLLLSSLQEFNARLALQRPTTKSKLHVDTEVWTFGSTAQKVKPFRADLNEGQDDLAESVRTFGKLSEQLGSTADHLALGEIAASLTPKEIEDIRKQKTLDIVFEITDGGADSPAASRVVVDGLNETGVVTRAFQIGAVSDDERAKFERVWNDGRESRYGEVVGEDIANLIPAVTKALKRLLSNVRL